MATSDVKSLCSPKKALLPTLIKKKIVGCERATPVSLQDVSCQAVSRSKLSLNRKRPLQTIQVLGLNEEFDVEAKKARLGSHLSLNVEQDHPSQMNGHKSLESRYGSSSNSVSSKTPKPPPVASLSNLGNTCFLNSVLYTLRFTPGFLHNLHHMVHDLGVGANSSKTHKRTNGIQEKNSQTNGSTNNIVDADTELVHDVIDQLHELFRTLSSTDDTDSRDPLAPSHFLAAVGRLNPMFEGNQQQDAPEMLDCILNLLQEIKIPAVAVQITDVNDENKPINDKQESVEKKSKKKSTKSTFLSSSNAQNTTTTNTSSNFQNGVSGKSVVQVDTTLPNFVKENFVGKSVMGTRCLECETSNYRSETFTNICISLAFEEEGTLVSVEDLLKREINESETLRENNKYWCAECSRLNEAQRSVQYETLPKIMVLQLKRFTATGNKNYMSKMNDYIKTPLTMACFCTECSQVGCREYPKHYYRLYAVIMHLGATIASGHYIAYVRASDPASDYLNCQRNSTVERKNKKGIMKYFSRSSDGGRGSLSNNGHSGSLSSVNGISSSNESTLCRSLSCCGLRTISQLACADSSVNNSLPSLSSIGSDRGLGAPNQQHFQNHVSSGTYTQRGSDFNESVTDHPNASVNLKNGGAPSYDSGDNVWLECDDDSISVISEKQFEEELSSKQSATTPYLLFYQQVK